MSIWGELVAARMVPLRYLVSFNPRPTADYNGDAVYLPMEAISEFGPVDTSRRRPFHDLRQGYSFVTDGDLVLAKVTPCFENGKGFVARNLPNGMAFATTEVTVMRPSGKIEADYLAWILQSTPFLEQGKSHMTGSGGLRRVPDSFVGSYSIPLPERRAQRAVADFLSRATARIETLILEQQRLIEMLLERRSAVIASALKPDDSWARQRIKRIGETSLGKMLDAGRSARPGDRLRPYIRAADIRADGSVNLLNLNEMPFSDAEMDVFDVRAGDVLLIEGGATVGRPGFIFEAAPGVAFQKTVNRLRVGPSTNARFVYWSMLHLYESSYYANHYGAVSFVHLTGEKLREIELHLPPIDEQCAIAEYLDEQTAKIDKLIVEASRLIDLARERRAALITAAVTGQINEWEAA